VVWHVDANISEQQIASIFIYLEDGANMTPETLMPLSRLHGVITKNTQYNFQLCEHVKSFKRSGKCMYLTGMK
jgi:hypothetical protein